MCVCILGVCVCVYILVWLGCLWLFSWSLVVGYWLEDVDGRWRRVGGGLP